MKKSIRQLIEKFSRGIILKRKLPTRYNNRRIYVTPESALKYYKFNLETNDKMLFDIVDKFVKVGDNVWDIGANIGILTLAAATKSKTGQVLAVEPDSTFVNILQKTQRANIDLNIKILPVAISDSIDILNFNVAERGGSTNYIETVKGSSQTGGIRIVKQVPTFTIDFLYKKFPAPSLIKIDIEGAEHLLFRGAITFFLSERPIILCEVGKETFNEVSIFLKNRNYKIYDGDKSELEEATINSINILAVPQ